MPSKKPHLNILGFSLIEIMVAITIVGIISAVSVGFIASLQKNSRDAQREADLRAIQAALQQYYADNNHYPDDLPLTTGGQITNCTGKSGCSSSNKVYLNNIPKDPVSGAAKPYCYRSEMSFSNNTNCGGSSSGQCHYYELCATMENASGTPSTCPSSCGNFKVTPL